MPLHPLFAFFLSCVARFSVLFCLGNSRELLKKRRRSSPCPFSVALLFSFLIQRERKRLHNKEWTRALLSYLIQKMDRSEEEETPLSSVSMSSLLFSSLRYVFLSSKRAKETPFAPFPFCLLQRKSGRQGTNRRQKNKRSEEGNII